MGDLFEITTCYHKLLFSWKNLILAILTDIGYLICEELLLVEEWWRK